MFVYITSFVFIFLLFVTGCRGKS